MKYEEGYNYTKNPYTGQYVKFVRRHCKCGHTVNFLTRHAVICRHCGSMVYPDDKFEFEKKVMKEIKKK